MLKALRGVCLTCFYVLGIAAVVAFFEYIALPVLLEATGCHRMDILLGLECGKGWAGEGWARRSVEIVLNLPVLFFYAFAFTFSKAARPSAEFMALLYFFDAILFLAMIYPLLFFFKRRS